MAHALFEMLAIVLCIAAYGAAYRLAEKRAA